MWNSANVKSISGFKGRLKTFNEKSIKSYWTEWSDYNIQLTKPLKCKFLRVARVQVKVSFCICPVSMTSSISTLYIYSCQKWDAGVNALLSWSCTAVLWVDYNSDFTLANRVISMIFMGAELGHLREWASQPHVLLRMWKLNLLDW